jgi:hypothetical protein
MTVLLVVTARREFFEVDVQCLAHPIDRLEVVPAEGLRTVPEAKFTALDDPRHGPEPCELVLQIVVPLDPTYEHAGLLAGVVRFLAHTDLVDGSD